MNDDKHKKKSRNFTPIDHLTRPVSTTSLTKEGEPAPISSEMAPKEELELTEPEPVIEDKEVEKYVEIKRDTPAIHPDLKKAGLSAIDSATLDPRHKVELPLSDEKIMQGLHQPIFSSFRWLAEFALFVLKHAHLTLKKIHGRVVRVITR